MEKMKDLAYYNGRITAINDMLMAVDHHDNLQNLKTLFQEAKERGNFVIHFGI